MANPNDPIKVKTPSEVFKEIITEVETAHVSKVNTSETDNQEKREIDEKTTSIYHRILEARAVQLEDDNAGRRDFSRQIFTVTVIWMFLVLVLIYHVGAGNLHYSDTVLVTLITTTTANVFGFMYIVVKYLFNNNQK